MVTMRPASAGLLAVMLVGCAGGKPEGDFSEGDGRGGGMADDGGPPTAPFADERSGPLPPSGGRAADTRPDAEGAELAEACPATDGGALDCDTAGCEARVACTLGRRCVEVGVGLLAPAAGGCLPFVDEACGDGRPASTQDDLLAAGQPFGPVAGYLEASGWRPGGSVDGQGGWRFGGADGPRGSQDALTATLELAPPGCEADCFGGTAVGWVPADWVPRGEGTEPGAVPWVLAVAVSADGRSVGLVSGQRVWARKRLAAPASRVTLRSDPFEGIGVEVEGDEVISATAALVPEGPLAFALAGRSAQGGRGPWVRAVTARAAPCQVADLGAGHRDVDLRRRDGAPWRPDGDFELAAPSLAAGPGIVLLAFEERPVPAATTDGEQTRAHLAVRTPQGGFVLLETSGGEPFSARLRSPRLLPGADGGWRLVGLGEEGNVVSLAVRVDPEVASAARGDRTVLLAPAEVAELPLLGPTAEPPAGGEPLGVDAAVAAVASPLRSLAAAVGTSGQPAVFLLGEANGRWRMGLHDPVAGRWAYQAGSHLGTFLEDLVARAEVVDLSLSVLGDSWSLLATVQRGARRHVEQILSADLLSWRSLGPVLRSDGSAVERLGVGHASEVHLDGQRLVVYEAFDGERQRLRQVSTPLPGP